MSIKILPVALLTVAFGFVLGIVPGLNENLHWNLWYIVPISGLLFGMAVGGMQFAACYKMNQPVGKYLIFYMAVMAMLGYLAVDYGIYKSIVIPIQDVEGIPDGDYHLSELISFWQYTKLNLGSSSVETQYGTDSIEFGAVGTTISYIADMLGAALAAGGVLVVCRQKYPFCSLCEKYKKRERRYDILFEYEESVADEMLKSIHEQMENGVYPQITAYLNELASSHFNKQGDIKISIDQRCCPSCLEATFLGSVHRKSGKNWNEVTDLKFRYDTLPKSDEPESAQA